VDVILVRTAKAKKLADNKLPKSTRKNL
jgi:hypothetical protein